MGGMENNMLNLTTHDLKRFHFPCCSLLICHTTKLLADALSCGALRRDEGTSVLPPSPTPSYDVTRPVPAGLSPRRWGPRCCHQVGDHSFCDCSISDRVIAFILGPHQGNITFNICALVRHTKGAVYEDRKDGITRARDKMILRHTKKSR